MNSDREVRDVLRRALPPQPGTDGWVAEARRRHRTRRTAVSAAVALAVIGLATPVVWNLVDGGDRTIPAVTVTPTPSVTATRSTSPTATPSPSATTSPSTTPSPTATATPVEASGALLAERCGQYAGTVTELPDGTLPAGAERLWLCDHNTEGDVLWEGPHEPLTAGIAEAIDGYNAAEVIGEEKNCSQAIPYGRSATVVAEYPDGTRRIVRAIAGGCDMLSDGTVARSGANDWLAALGDLWQRQRDSGQVVPTGTAEACNAAGTFFPYAPTFATAGSVCGVPLTEPDPSGARTATPIPADLLRPLGEAVVNESVDVDVEQAPEGPLISAVRAAQEGSLVTISLQNRWGDPLNLFYHSNGTWLWQGDGQLYSWTPSGVVAERLAPLLQGLWTVDLAAVACQSDAPLSGEAVPEGLVAGWVCGDEKDEQLSPLNPGVAQQIEAGFAAGPTIDYDPAAAQYHVWLLTDAGTILVVGITPDGVLGYVAPEGRRVAWQASAEVLQALRDSGAEI